MTEEPLVIGWLFYFRKGGIMSLYDKDGWLNFNYILGFKPTFIIMVGARQVGKTYGVFKRCIEENWTPMLVRRTQDEIDLCSIEKYNPFAELNKDLGEDIHIVKERNASRIVRIVGWTDEEKPVYEDIGIAVSLKAVSKYRGFGGGTITDIIYDEFIPENHVNRIKNEGDAVTNMYVTVSGNRELLGQPPLRMWMMANSNNIYNAVLDTFNLVDVYDEMQRKGQEVRFLEDRGILLLNIMKSPISEMRKKTALFKAIDNESEFAKMANSNEFSYNDGAHIMRKYGNPKDLIAVCQFGKIYIYLSKSRSNFMYISAHKYCEFEEYYDGNKDSKKTFKMKYSIYGEWDALGYIYYETYSCKYRFLNAIDKLGLLT
jgi:hypothetical protein